MNKLKSNNDLEINRGFEFLIRNKPKRHLNQYILFLKELVLSFKREINLYFEFSLSVKKHKTK